MVLTVDVRQWLGGKGCDRLRDARGEWLVASQGTKPLQPSYCCCLHGSPEKHLINGHRAAIGIAAQRFGRHRSRSPA
jgi:hypothetical protein